MIIDIIVEKAHPINPHLRMTHFDFIIEGKPDYPVLAQIFKGAVPGPHIVPCVSNGELVVVMTRGYASQEDVLKVYENISKIANKGDLIRARAALSLG